MAEISSLLKTLQLDETLPGVKSALNNFLALSNADKASRRLREAKKIFPLIFGDDAVSESDVSYSERNKTTWSTHCQLAPGIILTPQTTSDVGKAIALCQLFDIKFSIRSGGHLHNPGFTSNDGGVVFSMKKFNAVLLSEDRSAVQIGVGQTWLDVYKALEGHGLAVTGGRHPSVGVGGLLLGGGLAFQNSERGLASHGIIEYEIVLADSTVIKVNATNNKDLFWGLKGGGPNFGIVTNVTMSTIPNKFWCECRAYSPEDNADLFKCIMAYQKENESDTKAALICHLIEELTLVHFIYADPVEERPAVFDIFDQLECVSQVVPPKISTVLEIVSAFAKFTAGEPENHCMRTMTSCPDLEVYEAAESAFLQQIELVKSIPGAQIAMNTQPIPSSASRACDSRGGNPLGLKAVPQQWLVIVTEWSHPEDEKIMFEASRTIIDSAEAAAKKNGSYLNFKYSNYASRDQDPLSTYGSDNVQRLRSIAKEIDPQGVFQKLQNDGWLLSRTA